MYTDELGSSEVVGHPANARDADDSRLFWFWVVNPTMNGNECTTDNKPFLSGSVELGSTY